jgi:hypothetical protein
MHERGVLDDNEGQWCLGLKSPKKKSGCKAKRARSPGGGLPPRRDHKAVIA